MEILQRTPGQLLARISPRLWQIVFIFPAPVNCWFWKETDGFTMIDAGQPWNAAALLRAIQFLGEPLRRIVITHAHPDHAGSAAELASETGALVYAHEQDIHYLQGRACMADADGYGPCRLLLSTARFLRLLDPPPIEKIVAVSKDDMIGTLRVIYTPGHTPGSISMWSEDDGFLFCGDNISSTVKKLSLNLTWFTLDFDRLKCSTEQYRELPVNMLLPGHGPAFGGEKCSRELRRLLGGGSVY